MSDRQPSEQERQEKLEELQARLRALTEERKAELAQAQRPPDADSAPLAAAVDAETADTGGVGSSNAAQADVPPTPPAASPPPAPPALEPATRPSFEPSPEASPGPVSAPLTPPAPETAPAAPTAASRTGRANARFTRSMTGMQALVDHARKRALRLKGRVESEPADQPVVTRVKRAWVPPAAVVLGLGLAGAIVHWQLGDPRNPNLSDGALSAAETTDAGPRVRTATVKGHADRDVGEPVLDDPTVGSLTDDPIAGSEMSVAEVRRPPPPSQISVSEEGLEETPIVLRSVEPDLDLAAPAVPLRNPLNSGASDAALDNPTDRPTFIAYEVAPKLENPGEIRRALQSLYPSQLRNAGVEGTVHVRVFIDEAGTVREIEVMESSGYELLDEAALKAAEKMRFTPAMSRDKTTAVWLELPITFR